MTVLHVVDADTGDIVEIDLSNPSGVIFVQDADTGDSIPIPLSAISSYTHNEDLRFPATAINPPGASADPARNLSDGSLEFSASITNTLAFFVQLPHDWVEGTPVYAHVHWQPNSTNTGNVLWRLEYSCANIDGTFPVATVVDKVVASSGVVARHQLDNIATIPMTGKTVSCMLKCILSRIGGDGLDTFTSTAKLLEIDFHYRRYGYGTTVIPE
jgi:hypothetical protein